MKKKGEKWIASRLVAFFLTQSRLNIDVFVASVDASFTLVVNCNFSLREVVGRLQFAVFKKFASAYYTKLQEKS